MVDELVPIEMCSENPSDLELKERLAKDVDAVFDRYVGTVRTEQGYADYYVVIGRNRVPYIVVVRRACPPLEELGTESEEIVHE